MEKYHLRRSEKAIEDPDELIEAISSQRIMTIAMSKENQPYLVTVNYAFDKQQNCFYFHCALKGKKIEYLKANPIVWGQILEDKGYLEGECDHGFRSIHFKGKVEFLTKDEEKRVGLQLLIDQQEENPAPRKERLTKTASLEKVGVAKVLIEGISGKRSPVSSITETAS
ncbi:MAG: pyridoxamine 5'-phosphate oxidase family protein [Candidatus Hodarchaeota archaeon]